MSVDLGGRRIIKKKNNCKKEVQIHQFMFPHCVISQIKNTIKITPGGNNRKIIFVFFFQAEDGIRDDLVTGVQTCAIPISTSNGLACIFPETPALLIKTLISL